LTHESKDAADRADHWHDRHRPQSHAAAHLPNECARATLLADRADAFRQATLDGQAKHVRQNRNRSQRRRQAMLAEKLRTDVRSAAAELKSIATGLRGVIGVHRELIDAVLERGHLL
jgi:hypothetical protein